MKYSKNMSFVDEQNGFLLAILGSNDGVWDWCFKTQKLFFCDRWKSMLGYLPDEIGHALEEWKVRVHPEDLSWVEQAVTEHLTGKTEFFVAEYRIRHKKGHFLWILDRGRAQFDEAGSPVRMVGTHFDVTKRRLSEDAVKNLIEDFRTILHLSPEGFVAFNKCGLVKYVTPAFETLTLLSAGQLVGLNKEQFWDLMGSLIKPQSIVGNISAARQSLGRSLGLRRCLIELVEPADLVLMVNQIAGGTSDVNEILCFRDVSYEFEIDRAKTEYLSKAAHELRSPLASIYGFSELLLAESNTSRRKEFIDIIYQQAQVMNHLINEMLDLARIEYRQRDDFVIVNLTASDLVKRALSGFMPPVGREAPELKAESGNLTISVDVKKASQVILNVLSNAYKYSPSGGPVKIQIKEVPATEKESNAAIIICDEGIGMTQCQVEKIFERFFRVSPNSNTPGTGLGMSIVREIMSALNGHVKVDSQIGTGTKVALYFPSA